MTPRMEAILVKAALAVLVVYAAIILTFAIVTTPCFGARL